MAEIKFKIYDKNKNKLINGTGYSLTSDGEVQTFNKNGLPEGTINNRHLKPILYSGKKDITGRDIYEGFIIERKSEVTGEEEIIGIVVLNECRWWIVDKIYERAVPLFSETAIDRVIGNIYEGVLNKNIDKTLEEMGDVGNENRVNR